jgi:shikimate dehydrogenase
VYEECADAQIIVNCTPVGMYPNNLISPVVLSKFKKCVGVVDMIYNPAKTKLLLDAMALGINCIGGLDMLTAQAKRACELFMGESINDGEIDRITHKISVQQSNIVLIGMPGCGKSTIAEQLSRLTGKDVLDTDKMIVESQGRSIPSIFAEDGEDFFRERESEAVALAGNQVSKIIATGGGVVTRSVNYAPLAQNGTIVFIHRPICELETQGRPLSQSSDLELMYKKRLPLYRLFCDVEVANDTTPDECAEKIIKILERN